MPSNNKGKNKHVKAVMKAYKKISSTLLTVILLLFTISCGKEDISIQPEDNLPIQHTQLEARTSGSCETLPGFCGRGIYAEEAASQDVFGLVSNPFGITGVNHVYGGEVAFLIPDMQDPAQMNPVYSVGGAMDEDVFVEYDGETITVYFKTDNEYLKSLKMDADGESVTIPNAIHKLLESETTEAKADFSKTGIQSEFSTNDITSNLSDGSLTVTNRNNIQISNPDDGEQYLRINLCSFILTSTVRRYRTEFAEAYGIISPTSNLDFAISDAVQSCSPSFCTDCPISACVISEIVNDPRISGADLVINSIKLNYARVAFELDESSVDDMSEFFNSVTLDQILTIQCGTFGVDGADEGPNICEAALIASGPLAFGCSLAILDNSGDAFAETENVVVNSTSRVNNCADAFRHAYFNALNTRSCGRGMANLFGIAHECVIVGSPELDEQMDLNNNEDGQRIADDNPNFTDQQISDAIVNEINLGSLDQILPLDAASQIIPSQSQLVQTTNGCL